jgi:AraC-like DNA-binding protein
VSHAEEVTEIFDLMLRCGLPQSAHSGALCQQLVGVLLAKVRQRRLPDSRHDDQAAVTFEAFRRLLQERCEEWQSVEAACREYGMTPAYACRLFARFGEHSPYQFLVRQRMSLAAEWLGTEQALVREVAVRLGFADPYQFSRTFKRVFGIAPAAFRRAQAGFTGSVAAEPTGAVLAAQSAKASRR